MGPWGGMAGREAEEDRVLWPPWPARPSWRCGCPRPPRSVAAPPGPEPPGPASAGSRGPGLGLCRLCFRPLCRKIATYDAEIQHLYEEMEQQIKSEKEQFLLKVRGPSRGRAGRAPASWTPAPRQGGGGSPRALLLPRSLLRLFIAAHLSPSSAACNMLVVVTDRGLSPSATTSAPRARGSFSFTH